LMNLKNSEFWVFLGFVDFGGKESEERGEKREREGGRGEFAII